MAKTDEAYFWERVNKTRSPKGCWLWTGSVTKKKYGQTRRGLWGNLAHRQSWYIHRGPIPAGVFVCHTCDNPRCVNPLHLFLGNAAGNALDMMAKGRSHSQRSRKRKASAQNKPPKLKTIYLLTGRQVLEIRYLAEMGWDLSTLSLTYEIPEKEVGKIVHRRLFPEITESHQKEFAEKYFWSESLGFVQRERPKQGATIIL